MLVQPIQPEQLDTRIFHLFDKQWLLLTAGDFAQRKYNAMTVSWGSLGVIWGKPFVQVVVRPVRHTHQFIERFDTFTVTAFPEARRAALQLLGTKSGRDGDKIAEAGLTPVASTAVAAPSFAEAELVLECRKIFRKAFEPKDFLDPGIEANYPEKDYHTSFFGEIVAVRATPKFVAT